MHTQTKPCLSLYRYTPYRLTYDTKHTEEDRARVTVTLALALVWHGLLNVPNRLHEEDPKPWH